MLQIRNGLFETNSSSVHTMVLCSADDYDKWIKGELLLNLYYDDPYMWKHWDPDTERYVDTTKGMPPQFVTEEEAAYYDENYPYPEMEKTWDGYNLDFKDEYGVWCSRKFITFDEYRRTVAYEFESFSDEYTTPGGETIVAFGYFGHD